MSYKVYEVSEAFAKFTITVAREMMSINYVGNSREKKMTTQINFTLYWNERKKRKKN